MHQLDRSKPGDLSRRDTDTYFSLAHPGIFHHNEYLTVPAFSAAPSFATMRTRGEPPGVGAWSSGHSIVSQRPVLGSGSSANVATVPLARNF